MFMRAYGFAGRSKRVLALLGSFYVGLLGVDIWAFCTHVEIPPPAFYFLFDLFFGGTGCFPNYGSDAMAVRIGVSGIFHFSLTVNVDRRFDEQASMVYLDLLQEYRMLLSTVISLPPLSWISYLLLWSSLYVSFLIPKTS